MIGDHIEVKILSVDGDQVKLGIVAPNSVKVYRTEIFETIQEQNRVAVQQDIEILKKLLKVNEDNN